MHIFNRIEERTMRPVILLIAILAISLASGFLETLYGQGQSFGYQGIPEVWIDDDYTPQTPGWGVTAFDKIQDGIDAVDIRGTVNVLEGTYFDPIVVHKTITLIGDNNETAVIDGGDHSISMVTVVSDGSGSIIDNLTVRSCRFKSVYIQSAYNITIQHCIFHDNDWGMFFIDSIDITLTDNEFSNNKYAGITFTSEDIALTNIYISDNIFTGNGDKAISIQGQYQLSAASITITNNTIENGDGYGMILRKVCNSTVANNILIGNDYSGIHLNDNSNYNRISGNYFNSDLYEHSNSITIAVKCCWNIIEDNISYNSNSFCQIISQSSDNTVVHNVAYNNNSDNGIEIANYSHRNLITDNVIDGSDNGIYVFYYSADNIIEGNYLSHNICGMKARMTSSTSINKNTLLLNQEDGIRVVSSSSNLIKENIIALNGQYGVYSESGNDNAFYHNSFIYNGAGNAYDANNSNWDNGYPDGGNYWDDYTGTDFDGDGIGDEPYVITGDISDQYPLMSPYNGGTLFSDGVVLSASDGGSIAFQLHSGTTQERRHYLILGSKSGTEPGIPLPGGSATLPINWDGFTDFMLGNLNSAVFVDFLSNLDASGHGHADLVVSQGAIPISWIGSTLYFAYLLDFPFDAVSNPVKIEIVP